MEKKEPLYAAGGKLEEVPQKKMQLLQDPVIPPLDIYPLCQKEISTSQK